MNYPKPLPKSLSSSRFCLLVLLGFLAMPVFGQPTNNPFLSKYQKFTGQQHWTEEIQWDKVVNIVEAAGISMDSARNVESWNDIYTFYRDSLANAGGGVLYFPSLGFEVNLGVKKPFPYKFDDDIRLVSNVVLRGDKPGTNNAKSQGFNPPTLFEFPEYDLQTGGPEFEGTPNSTAFKEITADPDEDLRYSGLVHLNINAARIVLHSRYAPRNVDGRQPFVKVNDFEQILIFGVRNNNAAQPEPNVPDESIGTNGQQKWQRYSWRFAANIDINVSQNCIIANCRLNDFDRNDSLVISSDNQSMPGYIAAGQAPDGVTPRFRYTDHYGILLNRFKRDPEDRSAIAYLVQPTPAQEPSLFSPGNYVRDNWVFKTKRVGIQAGGLGVVIKDNVIRDDSSKTEFLNPSGTDWRTGNKGPSSNENRGIDIAGWGGLVEGNDIEVFRHHFTQLTGQPYTGDGEGYYMQGTGGSNNPRDITFANNKVVTKCIDLNGCVPDKCINGIANVNWVDNVTIENNDGGCLPLRVNANNPQGGQDVDRGNRQFLNNVVVRNNTNHAWLRLTGEKGGVKSFLYNNSRNGAWNDQDNSIIRTCNVAVNPNGSTDDADNTNSGYRADGCNEPVVATTCNGSDSSFHEIRLVSPDSSLTTDLAGKTLDVKAAYDGLFCPADSVVFYANQEVIGVVESPDVGGQTTEVSLDGGYTVPDSVKSVCLSAELYVTYTFTNDNNEVDTLPYVGKSNIVCLPNPKLTVGLEDEMEPSALQNLSQANVFPNPTTGRVTLKLDNQQAGPTEVGIYNINGQTIEARSINKGSGLYQTSFDLSQQPAGMYFIRIVQNGQRIIKKVVKK